MVRVQEIQAAIEALPEAEYARLREWFWSEIGRNGTNKLSAPLMQVS